jgi:hypothetical protein
MDAEHNDPDVHREGDDGQPPATRARKNESDAVRRDMAYSPASERETQQKQADPLPETLDEDIDTDQVKLAPGTGGPDDQGDVEVPPEDFNLPGGASRDGAAS